MVLGFFLSLFFKDDFSHYLTGQLWGTENGRRWWEKTCCKGPQTGLEAGPLPKTQPPAWVAHQLNYQGTLEMFFYEGVLFLFALFFFILWMHIDFNAFYVFVFKSISILIFTITTWCFFSPSYDGFIYYAWFLCYACFMSFFCQALGACNFFGSTRSCISCMKGAIQNSLLLACL